MKRFLFAILIWLSAVAATQAGDFTIPGSRMQSGSECKLINGEFVCWVPGFSPQDPNLKLRYSSGLGDTTLKGDLRVTSTEQNPILDDPDLILQRLNPAPANGDVLASIQFQGYDSALNSTTYGKFSMDSPTITDGAETGRLFLDLRTTGTSVPEYVWTGTDFYPFSNDGNSLGKAGNAFSDLYLASGGVINVGNGALTLTESSGDVTIAGTGNAGVTLLSADAGATLDPDLILDRDSPTPADTDEIGQILFRGNNDLLADTIYARITGQILDTTNPEEDGKLNFYVMKAGTIDWILTLTPTELRPVLNDGLALGAAGIAYSDLFLAEGGVINWDSGDATFTQSGDTLTTAGILQFNLDDEAELRFFEEDAGGANYIGFKAPTSVTSNFTCTLEDDANPIPDSCVGDGVDGGGGGGDSIRIEDGNNVGTFTEATDPDFDDSGDINFAIDTGATPDSITATVRADSVALGTDTTNDYVGTVADGTGIDGTATGEGSTYTPTFDATEINSATWGAGSFTTFTFDAGATDPTFTAGSGTFTLQGITSFRQADAANAGGEIRILEDPGTGSNYKSFLAPASIAADTTCTLEDDANFIPDTCVGDGSDDDVPEVGDFGALVGGTGIDNNSGTLDFDATEVTPSVTWGAGSFTTFTFNAGATDPTLSFGSATMTVEAITSFRQADASNVGGTIRLLEDPGTGSNFIALLAPTSITSDVTCTLEDDANPIPDSCVGDGTDAGGSGDAIRVEDGDNAGTFTAMSDADFDDSGDINFVRAAGPPDVVTATVRADSVALTTDTTGNYVATVADGTGIDGTASGEGATYTPTFDATEINSATWGDNTQATITQTYDTSSTGDITFDVVNNQITFDNALNTGLSFNLDNSSTLAFFEDDGNGANFKAFVAPATFSGSNTCTFEDDANFIPDSCVGDGSDDDIPEVGDFGALVGGAGIDNNSGTLDLDLTEVDNGTWGSNDGFTSFTFNSGTTDPVLSAGDASFTFEAITSIRRADAANAGGQLRLLEDPGTGANFIALLAPAAITSDVTCTLENDANPIPDSCVGDGTDGGGGLTDPVTLTSTDAGAAAGPTINYDRDSASPAANDDIGITVFIGNDDAAANQTYADIRSRIISPAAAGPDGALIFRTVNNDTLLEALRLDDFNVAITGGAESNSHGAFTGGTRRPRLQALDDSIDGGSIGMEVFSTTDADAPQLLMAKIGGATIGTFSVVVADETLGEFSFQGGDGTDLAKGASIRAEVDGSPGAGDMPTRLELATSADASETPTERFRINSAGALGVAGANFGTTNQAFLSGGSAAAPSWTSIIGKKSLWVGAGSLIPNFTNGCAPVDSETGTNDVMYRTCSYDTTTQESAQYQIRMPDTWDESTVTFIPVWSHPSTATNFGVVWELACLSSSNDDALDTAFGTAQTSTDTGGTTDDVYMGPESSAITCAGTPAAGDYVTLRVRRVPGDAADTLAVDARLHGFTFYYTESSFVEP